MKQAHMIIFVFYTLHQRCFKETIQDISIIKHIFVTNRYNSTNCKKSFLLKTKCIIKSCFDYMYRWCSFDCVMNCAFADKCAWTYATVDIGMGFF